MRLLNRFKKDKSIVYTLSGGAAYGLAHVGVLKYLEEAGVRPAAIAGTSMGAIVGGLYAYGYEAAQIEQISERVRSLELVKLFFPSFPRGGIIDTDGIRDFFYGFIQDMRVEDLPVKFRSVAVDINTGEEIIFDRGRLIDAIIASMSIPAVFKPYYYAGRYLVDGGLVNNLPWDVAQTMGDINIVVDVAPQSKQPDPECLFTSDILTSESGEPEIGRRKHGGNGKDENRLKSEAFGEQLKKLIQSIQNGKDSFSVKELTARFAKATEEKKVAQGLPEIITHMMAIIHESTQSPPKNTPVKSVYLHIDLMKYALNDFHKADEIIDEGYRTARDDPKFSKEIKKLSRKMS